MSKGDDLMSEKLIAIVGMGKGISMAVARRFGKEGYRIAMISRSESNLIRHQRELNGDGYKSLYFVADAGNQDILKKAFAELKAELGSPEVLVYNAAIVRTARPTSLTYFNLIEDFKVNVAGALVAVQQVLPAMRNKKRGTIIFTGGGLALNPFLDYASLAIGKAGIRSLATTLSQELKMDGVHIVTVTICGWVREQDNKYSLAKIADLYFSLHTKKAGEFKHEIVY